MKSFYFRYRDDSDVYYWGNLREHFINTTVKGSPSHRCSTEDAMYKVHNKDWIVTDSDGKELEESNDGYL